MEKIMIDKDILQQKYIVENLDCKTIAKQLNVSHDTIKRRIREYDLYIPNKKYKPTHLGIHSNVEKNIVKDYVENMSMSELSKKYNIHRSVLQTMLKKHNIALRKRTVQYTYNIHAFDDITPESCYWAGFIAADGYLRYNRNSLTIKIHIKDKNHLDKFADFIKFTGNIKIEDPICLNPLKQYCKIVVNGDFFPKALKQNFNITPQKTYTLQPPKIPDELMPHYLRGYFDGDGHISSITSDYCTITFTSGSSNILEFIKNYFYNKNIKVRKSKANDTEKPPTHNNVQIMYRCKNALKICDMMYHDSNQNIRLDRKYELYNYWKNKEALNE